jgi:molybdopterin biosynthesis enzyme
MPILSSYDEILEVLEILKFRKILQQNRKTYRWAIRRFNEKSIATFKSITADDEYSSTTFK